jgi:hypothetical protein
MSKHVPVPPELQHLIEKREQGDDRRKSKTPASGAKPANGAGASPQAERRRKSDRRRRKSGS